MPPEKDCGTVFQRHRTDAVLFAFLAAAHQIVTDDADAHLHVVQGALVDAQSRTLTYNNARLSGTASLLHGDIAYMMGQILLPYNQYTQTIRHDEAFADDSRYAGLALHH